MTIEEALYSYLKSHAGLSALVGDRIYPIVIPADASLPAVAIQRISTPRVRSHSGASNLAHPRFQFSCVATTRKVAQQVADQVRAALEGYHATMAGSVRVDAGFVDNERHLYEPASDHYVAQVDVIIWHQE